MIRKVITNLDSPKVPGPDCIPVELLKKFGPELSHKPPEPFNVSEGILFFRFFF